MPQSADRNFKLGHYRIARSVSKRLTSMVKWFCCVGIVRPQAPAVRPANPLPRYQKQPLRNNFALLKTKGLIRPEIKNLRTHGNSLQINGFNPFRLTFMRTLSSCRKCNPLHFKGLRTLCKKHPGGMPQIASSPRIGAASLFVFR